MNCTIQMTASTINPTAKKYMIRTAGFEKSVREDNNEGVPPVRPVVTAITGIAAAVSVGFEVGVEVGASVGSAIRTSPRYGRIIAFIVS